MESLGLLIVREESWLNKLNPEAAYLRGVGVLILDDRSDCIGHDAVTSCAPIGGDRTQDVPLGGVQFNGFWDGGGFHKFMSITVIKS